MDKEVWYQTRDFLDVREGTVHFLILFYWGFDCFKFKIIK